MEAFCSKCGRDIPGSYAGDFECSACREHPPRFEAARSAAHFEGPIRTLVHALKYRRGDFVVPDLVDLLEACHSRHYAAEPIDMICPVPMHPVKQRRRGYNQAGLLAAELGKRLELPVLADAIVRVRNTPTQTHLNAAERRVNMSQAFAENPVLEGWLVGRTVLLVDDVMTTGSTLSEAAAALHAAGAARVLALTIARD